VKNVIVTGATGFVGLTLVAEIRRRFGSECVVVALGSKDVDLASRDETFAWFEKKAPSFPCDHIIHLAALYKAGDWPVKHPATQFHVNFSINVNLLEAWKRSFPTAKLTSILSYCMYPSHPHPHPESELYGTEPEDYLFAYAMTKKALLIGQRAYRQEYGLQSTSVVLPTVFGPGDSFAETSHVMGALIGKFVRAARAGAPSVEVWGDGNQEREFLFVEDAADGIITAAKRSTLDAVNLGTGSAYRVGDVARWIKEGAGFTGSIAFNTGRFIGVHSRVLDVTRAREQLAWTAHVPVKEGIRRTVKWYAASLDTAQEALPSVG
jgi:GDP-L-fucose synthase